ncbi:MAG TPA: VWA domain-containing protein [Gemmatimonadaceae bacterium]|nr:VWA domain-containing protein [Gemmatimonadaceae bacterium]
MRDRDPVAFVTSFSRALRDRGMRATPASSIEAIRALTAVDITDKDDVYFALRSVLATRRQDFAQFDRLFEEWWGSHNHEGGRDRTAAPRQPPAKPLRTGPWFAPKVVTAPTHLTWRAVPPAETRDDETVPLAAPSTRDATGSKDFQHYDDADLQHLEDAAARIVRRLRSRRSRRWRIARRGPRVDARRIVRLALSTGGDPIRLARRERKLRRTKLVVVCDVSGSMDLYSRFLLQVLYALQHAFARVEAFVFSTRLVRVSDALSTNSYRAALHALAGVKDGGWSGGTKIGECVEALRVGWPRLFDRRTAVIILSDGWETGDPAILASALRGLRRRAGRIIWLNPLLGSPGYQPLTAGMQAALPHVDVFASAHDLASIERLATHLSF